MQLTHVFQVALLAVVPINAAPAAKPEALSTNPTNPLIKRTNFTPVSYGHKPNLLNSGVTVQTPENARAWPLQSVQNAFNDLVTNENLPANQRPTAGTRAYPQQYRGPNGTPSDPPVIAALDAIPECRTGQPQTKFFEYPLLDPPFATGPEGSQGPDRVIAISPNIGPGGTRTYTYCLAITHRGGTSPSDPSFRPCVNAP